MTTSISPQSLGRRELIESLRSNVCPSCGDGKRPRQTFCRSCWMLLDQPVRTRLYDPVGRGYEEAVADAVSKLELTEIFLPRGRIR
jgi:hypothetical protein